MILKPLKGKEEGDARGTMLVSWLDSNESCISQFFFSFFNLKHIFTVRESVRMPLGVSAPKGCKRLECQMSKDTLEMPHETTRKCKEVLCGAEGTFGYFFLEFSKSWHGALRDASKTDEK